MRSPFWQNLVHDLECAHSYCFSSRKFFRFLPTQRGREREREREIGRSILVFGVTLYSRKLYFRRCGFFCCNKTQKHVDVGWTVSTYPLSIQVGWREGRWGHSCTARYTKSVRTSSWWIALNVNLMPQGTREEIKHYMQHWEYLIPMVKGKDVVVEVQAVNIKVILSHYQIWFRKKAFQFRTISTYVPKQSRDLNLWVFDPNDGMCLSKTLSRKNLHFVI